MSKLSNDELILLDNLMYLEWEANEDEKFSNIIDRLLDERELKNLLDNMSNCIVKMPIYQWMNILKQSRNKPNLSELRVKNVENHKSGMRVACFIDDDGNVTVAFRGTTTQKEWDDNSQGAYEYDTIQQIDALNYINGLEYDNITVTGHSKGGNKAQYATVLSPKIAKCVSINGQGFSNEFLNKYKEKIQINKSKITSINAKYDYVNCLFNGISDKTHYIKTKFQVNPFDYHRADILLDEDGNLREEVNRGIFSKLVNDFSTSLISDLPEDIRSLTIDGIIGGVELILCKGETSERFIKIVGGIIIMLAYGQYFKYKETFAISYIALQALTLPLMFWGDFINIEETNSKELFDKVISKITYISDGITKKINTIEDSKNIVTEAVSKAVTNLIDGLKAQELKE